MSKLSWGRPKIEIGKLGENDAAPTTWITVDNPVEDSTQLTTNDGEVQEAKGEGGELVDVRQAANNYEFAFELYKKKGVQFPVEDVDGKVDGFYAMRLTPEDPTVEGIQFAKSVMSAGDTYTAKDGQRKPYKMRVLNAATGSTILPYTAPSGT